FVNEFSNKSELPREAAEKFVKLLAPFSPHIGEELWNVLGHAESIAYEPWPNYNEEFLKVDEVEVLVQVSGRPKARLMMPPTAAQDEMQRLALEDASVQAALAGLTVRKVICVPGRLINIVATP
ncbi:MAG: class I tRNA ligase family protein, partial [Victivallaceae bacterium]